MSAPAENLVSDDFAGRVLRDAEAALVKPAALTDDARYFAAAAFALGRDRAARIEMANADRSEAA
jgi:hypothetical protein